MVYSDEQVARLESIVDALCGKGLFKICRTNQPYNGGSWRVYAVRENRY